MDNPNLRCPKCNDKMGFVLVRGEDGLRGFKCLKCKHHWTAGFSGGHYILSKYLQRDYLDWDH